MTNDEVAASSRRARAAPALVAGGNPQIAKADGDAPVQAYIAANATLGAASTRSSCEPSPACARR